MFVPSWLCSIFLETKEMEFKLPGNQALEALETLGSQLSAGEKQSSDRLRQEQALALPLDMLSELVPYQDLHCVPSYS